MDKKLRIAMVGCGNISSYHLNAIAAMRPQRVEVTAVVDPNTSRATAFARTVQQHLGQGNTPPRVFRTVEEAIASDPSCELFEACDVMVPSWDTPAEGDLHERVACAVLNSGRHLLLEKPIAVTSSAAKRIVECAAGAVRQADADDDDDDDDNADRSQSQRVPRVVFAVAENAQYWPEIVEVGRLLEEGAIGNVLTAYAKFWESAMGEWAVDYLPGSWRCDESKLPAASFTFDGATHWIRPLRMWFGEVAAVTGSMGVAVGHMAGASMSQHVFRFETGKTAIFESMLAPQAISDQPFFRIQGTKGEIVIDGFEGGARLYTVSDDGKSTKVREICKRGWDAGYALEYADFVAACLDGTPLVAGAESALADLKVVEAMCRAEEQSGAWARVSTTAAARL